MKKVAICLKGAVGKKGGPHDRFYNPGDLYKTGEYVDYVKVKDSIHKHIIEPNPNYQFDFFLHGWNLDLAQNLVEIYDPKLYLFEDNNLYNGVISSIIANQSDFGGVSGGLSLKKSLELMEMYEINKKFEYDMVIVYRYDVLLWKDMILDEYNIDEFLYVNAWNQSCQADFHFVMSKDNAYKFKYLYDSVALYSNAHGFHHWINNYVTKILGLKMKEDSISAGIDQEHLRLL
jgi:hypothetical protein